MSRTGSPCLRGPGDTGRCLSAGLPLAAGPREGRRGLRGALANAHPLGGPLGHPAEGAHLGGRRLPTMHACAERRVVDRSKALRVLEKSPVQALLGPGGGLLEEVERLLVEEALGTDAVGAFLHDVVDPPDHRVRGRLALGGPVEGLTFFTRCGSPPESTGACRARYSV